MVSCPRQLRCSLRPLHVATRGRATTLRCRFLVEGRCPVGGRSTADNGMSHLAREGLGRYCPFVRASRFVPSEQYPAPVCEPGQPPTGIRSKIFLPSGPGCGPAHPCPGVKPEPWARILRFFIPGRMRADQASWPSWASLSCSQCLDVLDGDAWVPPLWTHTKNGHTGRCAARTEGCIEGPSGVPEQGVVRK